MIRQAPERPVPGSATPGDSLKGETTVIEPSRPEQAIARRSAEVRATVPDLELSVTVAAETAIGRARAAGTGVSAIVLAAVATALRASPRANGAYRDGHYELYSRVNIGVMLSGPQAPTSATLLDADRRTSAELHHELIRLRARARSGELTSPEQAGATFTFTDLSEHGIDRGVPLVVPPQAAALSVGAVREVAVVGPHGVQPGHVMTLTLACDHRILFGDAAAAFLAAVAHELRGNVDPESEAA
jgi:pyruvate dehydrogenase E2 component (dihydrolipoamide acetyltransferase)